MRKNYICSSQVQEQVKNFILQDENYALGTSVHPEAYLFNYQDHIELDFLVYNKLQKLELNILEDTIKYPKTSKTLINFRKEMYLLGIEIEDLPTNTEVEKEIKICLENISELVIKPQILKENDFVIPNGLNFSTDFYTKKHQIQIDHSVEIESLHYHYAQNKRQEVEAMIQDIIKKDLKEITILVPNKTDYLPLIESVLLRYGMQGQIENRKIKLLSKQFSSFLEFVYEKNNRNFIKLLEHNSFLLQNPKDVLKYIMHYQLSFNEKLSHQYCTKEKSELFYIQTKIQDDLIKLETTLEELKRLSYIQAYEYIFDFYKVHYSEEILVFKAYFENYYQFISEDKHELILQHFKSFQSKVAMPDNWQFSDYNNIPIESNDNLYCLGLNAAHFPNINSLNGIIDEDYVEKIDKYPSLKKRSSFELQAKRKIYSLAKNTVFSYHRSNYEGKGLEPSFEIKDFCENRGVHESLWALDQIRYRKKRIPRLNPNIAKKLFTKNDIIYGSVSSLQKYANDPMQYFFENGLKLKEEQDISFNPMVFGNLNHEIVETSDFEKAWDHHVWSAFPNNSQIIKLIRDRNDSFMEENIEYLTEAQENCKLKPHEFEKKVTTLNNFDKVELLGYIDRIDINDDYFIIIDYKSSPTNLSESLVKEGKQLQLLTYASIISEQYKKKPLAVFYYSFAHPASISAGKYEYKTSKGIIPKSDIDFLAEWKNEKRFKGWFFEDPQGFFTSDEYWTGLNTKDGEVISRTKNVYDFQLSKSLLQDVYKGLYENITAGILDLDEIEFDLDEEQDIKKEIR